MRQHVGKLAIGIFAGLCATFIPRIITEISTYDPVGEIQLFRWDFVLLAVVLSLFLGGVVMMLKWNDPLRPPEIFMAALGVPALLAGAFNMSVSVGALSATASDITSLSREVALTNGIRTLTPETLTILDTPPDDQSGFIIPNGSFFIKRAFAQEAKTLGSTDQKFNPAQIYGGQKYFVVLKQFDDAKKAADAAKILRAIAPNATAVQGKQGYYVLQSVKPLSLPEATINALRIKREGGVSDIGLLPAAPAVQ